MVGMVVVVMVVVLVVVVVVAENKKNNLLYISVSRTEAGPRRFGGQGRSRLTL